MLKTPRANSEGAARLIEDSWTTDDLDGASVATFWDPPKPPRRPEHVPMQAHTWPVTVWARGVLAAVVGLVVRPQEPRLLGSHYSKRTVRSVWRNVVRSRLGVALLEAFAVIAVFDILIGTHTVVIR
jgi:hypothetical protein